MLETLAYLHASLKRWCKEDLKMAGHSKWANIRFRKQQQDNKKGKIFTKLIREITVAARLGGAELTTNPHLRTAVHKALAQNMTRDTINRAIQKGDRKDAGTHFEAVSYEGYGPGGSAVVLEALTDNRNRTAGQVRQMFSKMGGQLATTGSAAYLFEQYGVFLWDSISEAAAKAFLPELLEQSDVEDVAIEGVQTLLYVMPKSFHAMSHWLQEQKISLKCAEIEWIALEKIQLAPETLEKFKKLIAGLEDLEDVQNVYHNVLQWETESC